MHRDIKPENILIELDNEEEHIVTVKLVDFGLALVLEPGHTVNDACGTPAYVAPEVLKKHGYTHQVDLWSLGVISFLLYPIGRHSGRLRGRLPFNVQNRKELFDRICETDVEFDEAWNATTADCKDFVRRLLARDWRRRMTAAQALQHPWILHNLPRIRRKQYQYYVSIPRLFAKMKVDESLASEIRNFEEENVPAEERVVTTFRKGSANEVIGKRVSKFYEESDIQGI